MQDKLTKLWEEIDQTNINQWQSNVDKNNKENFLVQLTHSHAKPNDPSSKLLGSNFKRENAQNVRASHSYFPNGEQLNQFIIP